MPTVVEQTLANVTLNVAVVLVIALDVKFENVITCANESALLNIANNNNFVFIIKYLKFYSKVIGS